jgi:poly(A) polymerase
VQPTIYYVDEHAIDHDLIDRDALYVLTKLREAGFIAYLVGGGVRDLLLKRTPKDFDISSSARPEQVKQLFQRSCLLIGRRFRLAHVRFGHKIIEISTFRTGENDTDLIIQDNEWGSPEQDVLRRDFTINGLFYNPADHSIIDYVDGWKDLHQGVLRTIGDPFVRFKQDPVRMIRLLKFQARLGFNVDPKTRKTLLACREEIVKSSPARILEEIFRMLESGSSSPFFKLMMETELLEHLFPCLVLFLQGPHAESVYQYLEAADDLNKNYYRMPMDRAILSACLIYPILEQELKTKYLDRHLIPHFGEIMMLTGSVIQGIVTSSFSHFPRRISSLMGFILSMQYRLTPLAGRRHQALRLFRSKEFPLALRFLKIRGKVDPKLMELYDSWKEQFKQHSLPGERQRHHPSPHSSKPSAVNRG